MRREVEVRKIRSAEEYRMLEDLQVEVWGMRNYREAVPHHMLLAADRIGGVVLGAFDRETGRLIGFVFGTPGYRDGRAFLYSHMAGVAPSYRGRGVGYALKLAQREEALAKGFDLVLWTFDPLQGANARLNVSKLGAIARRFYENLYGKLEDEINAGRPTDRLEAEWWVSSRRVEKKMRGLLPPPRLEKLKELGAEKAVWSNGRCPETSSVGGELVLVETPGYLGAKCLEGWVRAFRKAFRELLGSGYTIVEFAQDERGRGAYVLWRSSLERILEGDAPWLE